MVEAEGAGSCTIKISDNEALEGKMSFYKKFGPGKYDQHYLKWTPKTRRQAVDPWPYKVWMAKQAHGFKLEVGCGPGGLNKYLRNCVFLDFSKIALTKRWKGRKRQRMLASVENMPFKSKTFNSVVASEVIEHTDSPKTFVSEVHRILKNGGKFIFSFPWRDPSPSHKYKRITKKLVYNWLKPYFKTHTFPPSLSKRRCIVVAVKSK